MVDTTHFYIFLFINLATIPTILVMLYQLAKKYRKYRDPQTGKADNVRFFVLLQIAFLFESIVYSLLYRLITLKDYEDNFESLNLSSMAISFMITTGISLLSYVYHKESWIYAGWFFYAGIILYGMFSGIIFRFFGWENTIIIGETITVNTNTFYLLNFFFTLVGQMAFVLFYIITGVKFKDNKIFGLGIFFLVPLISSLSSTNAILYAICYGFVAIYGIPYAMGKIRFFRQKPVQLVEAEVQA